MIRWVSQSHCFILRLLLRRHDQPIKAEEDDLEEGVAGSQGQRAAVEVGEGEHVVGVLALPTAVYPLPIPKHRNRPLAPNLNLNGVIAAADIVFQNVSIMEPMGSASLL